MAVTYSQNGVIVRQNPITQVAYAPNQNYTLIIDKNGYIGDKKYAAGNTYYATVDRSADFSSSQLGKVTILKQLHPIGTILINGNEYGIIQLENWLILDRNLSEPIGTLNTDYILPSSEHSDAGYFYRGTSLYDSSTSTITQLAQNFLSSVGDGWQFPTVEFYNFFKQTYGDIDSSYLRKETWYNGSNLFGLNFVGARYGTRPGSIDYSASLIGCYLGNRCDWIAVNQSGAVTYPEEYNVLQYYNPRRLIKKLS